MAFYGNSLLTFGLQWISQALLVGGAILGSNMKLFIKLSIYTLCNPEYTLTKAQNSTCSRLFTQCCLWWQRVGGDSDNHHWYIC